MAKYDLLLNATATGNGAPQGQAVSPHGPTNPNMPPLAQTFEVEVTGVGNVSATVQIIVSNDTGPDPSLYNWIAYGATIAATGTQGFANAGQSGSQAWKHFGAYITAISGTNTSVNVRMSA